MKTTRSHLVAWLFTPAIMLCGTLSLTGGCSKHEDLGGVIQADFVGEGKVGALVKANRWYPVTAPNRDMEFAKLIIVGRKSAKPQSLARRVTANLVAHNAVQIAGIRKGLLSTERGEVWSINSRMGQQRIVENGRRVVAKQQFSPAFFDMGDGMAGIGEPVTHHHWYEAVKTKTHSAAELYVSALGEPQGRFGGIRSIFRCTSGALRYNEHPDADEHVGNSEKEERPFRRIWGIPPMFVGLLLYYGSYLICFWGWNLFDDHRHRRAGLWGGLTLGCSAMLMGLGGSFVLFGIWW